MTVKVNINTDDLLKWARHFEEIPKNVGPAVARAINFIGTGIVDETVKYIVDSSGLEEDDVRRMIEVHEATSGDLTWEMDATAVAPPSLNWSKPWDKPDTSTFDQSALVKVVTMEDELVCQRCQDAAEQGPYTLEEAQRMLPIHPNCRCLLQPFYSYRKLPVVFGRAGQKPQLMTMRQLSRKVADNLEVVIRAK